MHRSLPHTVVIALALSLVACQSGTGTGTTITPVRRSSAPGIVKTSAKPTASSNVVVQPSPGATGAPSAGPSMFVPSAGPTPRPSGYVDPLPEDAFPTAAPATPTPANATPTPPPIVAPEVTDGQVLSNTLPAGIGELTGYVVEPIPGKAGEYRPMSGVTVLVSNKDDNTAKAKLTNASNGTFRVPDVALGEYYVRVEKSGYAADSAPTPMRIYPGYTSGHTLFLIIPAVAAP